MSVPLPSGDYRVQVSFKIGPYRDGLVNIRADDWESLQELLDSVPAGVATSIANAEKQIGLLETVAGALGPVTQIPSVQTGGPTLPTCAHGQRVFRSGNNGGKKWSAFFCALPQSGQNKCDPIWKDKDNAKDYPWP